MISVPEDARVLEGEAGVGSPWPRYREQLTLGMAAASLLWAPLAQGSVFGWGQDGHILLGVLTAALLGVTVFWDDQFSRRVGAWPVIALLFLAWIWLSVGWSPDRHEAVRTAGSWTAVIMAALSVNLYADSRRRRGVVLVTLVATVAGSVLLAWLQTRGVLVPGFEYYPGVGPHLVTGPYFNPSHFSGYLIGSAALLVTLLLFGRLRLWSLPMLALLLLLEYVDLLTDSSSIPAVLLATVLPFLVWLWTKNRVLGMVVVAICTVGMLAGAAYFFTPTGQVVFAQQQAKIGIHRDWSSFLRQREAVWRYGRNMWSSHPVLGAGIGQFQNEAPRYRKSEREVGAGMDRVGVNYAHSDVLQLGSELGVPGLLLALLVFGLSFFRFPAGLGGQWVWSAVPGLVLAGLYDAHLTAIPGTAAGVLGLLALAVVIRERTPQQTVAATVSEVQDRFRPTASAS